MPTVNARSSLQFGRIKMPVYRRLSKDGAAFFAIDAATPEPNRRIPRLDLFAGVRENIRHLVRQKYTPTYSSWLNQVEIWFSKIQRDVITRGVFTSVKDLARKLMRYIRNYNKTATPIRWIYNNVRHRIAPGAI